MKSCARCGKPFKPVKRFYRVCPGCWRSLKEEAEKPGEHCAARRGDGLACGAWAMRGRAFCVAHLRQGYGLFEPAVLKTREVRDEARLRHV